MSSSGAVITPSIVISAYTMTNDARKRKIFTNILLKTTIVRNIIES
jgi:hypothetical protein